jgi:hypothetical protein
MFYRKNLLRVFKQAVNKPVVEPRAPREAAGFKGSSVIAMKGDAFCLHENGAIRPPKKSGGFFGLPGKSNFQEVQKMLLEKTAL